LFEFEYVLGIITRDAWDLKKRMQASMREMRCRLQGGGGWCLAEHEHPWSMEHRAKAGLRREAGLGWAGAFVDVSAMNPSLRLVVIPLRVSEYLAVLD
jgi:hypothetical protein